MSKIKKLLAWPACIFVSLWLAGCAEQGKSDVVAEVLPFEKLCTYEKWKNIAFEGYLSPMTVDCKGTKTKNSGGKMNECTVQVFANPQSTGKSIPVTIDAQQGDLKFNEIVVPPASYKVEDFKVYDNEEKLIPVGTKVRITGTLRNTDQCNFDALRLDPVNN